MDIWEASLRGRLFKHFKQSTQNPRGEVLALYKDEFIWYDGTVKIVKDEALFAKVWEKMPQIMTLYDKNGW